MLQKSEKISKRLEAVSIELDFYKIQSWLSQSRLNTVLFSLEHFSCEEEMDAKLRWHYIISILSIVRIEEPELKSCLKYE